MPPGVVSAAATLLFGVVLMHGVQMLSKVEWDDRQFAAAGLAVLVGLGGLFVSPEALQTMPLVAKLLVQQPVISGGLTLVILHSLLCPAPSAPETAQAGRCQKHLSALTTFSGILTRALYEGSQSRKSHRNGE